MEIKVSELKRMDVKKGNIDQYLSFINHVKSGMEHPEYLGDFSKEDLEGLIDGGSYIFLYTYNEVFVASSIIIPAREKDIVKFELNLDYTKTMDYGPEAVAEIVRGNGVQKYILKDMDQFCKKLGYKHVVTTVHPDNNYSIKNIEEHGFQYVGQKEFTRGIRNIYQKDI